MNAEQKMKLEMDIVIYELQVFSEQLQNVFNLNILTRVIRISQIHTSKLLSNVMHRKKIEVPS